MNETREQPLTDSWIQFLLQGNKPVAELYESLFRSSMEITQLPFVQVLRIRRETHFRVEALVDQLGFGYKAGDEFPLEEMLDTEVIRKRDSIVIPNVASTAFVRHPAAARYGIRCYIGTPLLLNNDQIYGVLSLMDTRPHPLGKEELMRIGLLGKWLTQQIDIRQLSRELQSKNHRVSRLTQELQKLRAQVDQGSIRDSITDLLNSRYFNKILQTEAARGQRHTYPLSLLLLSTDGFSVLRRQMGLESTNSILRAVAILLKRYLRTIDSAARYNDEIFAILLPQTNQQGASIVAERIRATLAAHPFRSQSPASPQLNLTVSIGIAELFPNEDDPALGLLSRARRCLEQARNTGGNRVIIGPSPH